MLGRTVAPFLATLVLGACGGLNHVRIEQAATVIRDGEAATGAARVFLDHVAQARIDANIELVAVDPACGRSEPVLRAVPQLGGAPNTAGALCLLPGEAKGLRDTPIVLRPADRTLAPTLALVDALGAYVEALRLVVEKTPGDPLVPIDHALESARAAQALLVTLAPHVPAPDDGRLVAARGLAVLLVEVQQEASKARDLRVVIMRHPEGAASVVTALRASVDDWEQLRDADLALRLGTDLAARQLVIAQQPPAAATERRAVLRDYYLARAADRAEQELHPALVNLLNALGQSDVELRALLKRDPTLTAKQRDRAIETDRQRVTTAFNALAALAKSFGGA